MPRTIVGLDLEVCERVVREQPENANEWNTLCAAYMEHERWGDAREAVDHALTLDPELPIAWFNSANCAQMCGQYDLAVTHYRKALELDPGFHACRGNLIFLLDLMASTTPEQALAERLTYRSALWEKPSFEHVNTRDRDRPLRVGYVSAQFKLHSASRCFSPVITEHDPSQITPYFYCTLLPAQFDDVTDQYRNYVNEHWRQVHDLTSGALADLIHEDEIDILVDLAGHTEGGRLRTFCMKPAPIQVTAWGYITGTGCPELDYIFTDPIVAPPEYASHYVERLEYLPCVVPFEPQDWMPPVERPPSLRQSFITFGCLNRPSKIGQETLDLWSRVLARVPTSRLLLKSDEYERPTVLDRIVQGLVQAGVDRGRIGVLGGSPTLQHIAVYEGIDVILDPFPHSGGLTALEGLWQGAPIVTLIGPRPVERLASSFLSTIGLPEFIAKTPDEYVEIAAKAVSDVQRLARLRATMRERIRKSALMGRHYVDAVESSYRQMFLRWLGGD